MAMPTPGIAETATNVAVLAALWLAYSAVRELTASSSDLALANAGEVVDLQRRLGLDIELGLQSWFGSVAGYSAANVYYLAHFPVTIAFIVAAFVRDRSATYAVFRNAIVVTTGAALAVHVVYPLAPPRMLDGFIDSGAIFGPDPYSLPGSNGANQFAAMPSMHVGWALLVGFGLWSLARHRPALRLLAVAHPVVTSFVVVVTANHYVVDVLAGGGLAVIGWVVGGRLAGLRTEVPGERPSPNPTMGTGPSS